MRCILKRTTALLGCLVVGAQFVPMPQTHHEERAKPFHIMEAVADPDVGAILDRSCKDCHSDYTRWPWYSHIAPVSWLLSRDVAKGRAKLNFSQWAKEPVSSNARMEICDAVSDASMPLRPYTMLHRDARLSNLDVDLICTWASSPVAQAPAGKINRATLTAERRQNVVTRILLRRNH